VEDDGLAGGVGWRTLARVTASSPDVIEVQIPGGWDPTRFDPSSVPDWLRTAPVGQHVICTAQSRPDDTVVVTAWHGPLPIGLGPHPFTVDDYDFLPEAKLELVDGVLYGDPASRYAMTAALLCNIGLAEVVRLAPRELWEEALDAAPERG